MTVENRSVVLAARLTSAAIIVLGLYVAKPVLIPLGLAMLIAFMLQPAVRWLRRRGLPQGASVAVTALVFFLLFGLMGWLIAGQVRSLGPQIPEYQKKLAERIALVRTKLRGGVLDSMKSKMSEAMESAEAKERGKAIGEEGIRAEAGVVGGAAAEPEPTKVVLAEEEDTVEELSSAAGMLSPLGTAGLVVLLVVLLLLKWADLRGRLIALVDHHLTTTTAALDDAARRVSRYLAMQFMVNAGTGAAVWAGLAAIGIPYAGLLGLCAGLFRYVPFVGPLASAALAVVMSLATSTGWWPIVAVVGLFVVLELVLNNVVEPWLYGSRLGVSEIGIILATVAWTLLWGPAGLVLATPLTVCLVVLGENVPALAFLSKLLSDRVHLPVHATLTQRMMAGDTIEAADILASYREQASAADTYDAVVVPALARVRHEQRLGHLDAAQAAAMAAALPTMLDDWDERDTPAMVALTKESSVAVWSLCPMSEAAASLMPDRFSQIPCEFVRFNAQSLASDVTTRLAESKPLGLVLLHLDPSDFPRVLATLRRVRRVLPDLPVLVARWGESPVASEERDQLATLGATAVLTAPSELAAWINPRAQAVARVVPADEAASV